MVFLCTAVINISNLYPFVEIRIEFQNQIQKIIHYKITNTTFVKKYIL